MLKELATAPNCGHNCSELSRKLREGGWGVPAHQGLAGSLGLSQSILLEY